MDEQLRWISEHGADLAGYIANYAGRHRRTVENATAIYGADLEYLEMCKRRLAGCR